MTAAGPGETGRVALLLNNPFVADSRSWKIARSLAEAGWTVTVVARRADGLPDRETRDGFAIVRVDQPRPLAWLPAPRLPEAATGEQPAGGERGWVAGRVRVAAGRVRAAIVDVVGRGIQAIRYLRLAGQWADRIGAVVPGADVWQSEGLITLPVALALRSRRGGRVVYDARDLHVESSRFARLPGPWRRLLARRERAWARSADAVITANEPYAAVLLGTLGVRATVVHNGPLAAAAGGDAATVAADPIRDRLGLPASTRIVLYLGNVAPGRGVEQLCRAIADVPAAVLVVVGPGGPFRDRLIAEAAALPAADRIHFLPAVAPDEIPGWTAAADVAAMPIQPTTLNHRLTTPTRLFDALGAGVPVVASDLPGDGRDRARDRGRRAVRSDRPGVDRRCHPRGPRRSSGAAPGAPGRPPSRPLAARTPGSARSRRWSRCTGGSGPRADRPGRADPVAYPDPDAAGSTRGTEANRLALSSARSLCWATRSRYRSTISAGSPCADDLTLLEQDRPVAELTHEGQVVGDEDDRPWPCRRARGRGPGCVRGRSGRRFRAPRRAAGCRGSWLWRSRSPRRALMPGRIRLDRRVDERTDVGELDDRRAELGHLAGVDAR